MCHNLIFNLKTKNKPYAFSVKTVLIRKKSGIFPYKGCGIVNQKLLPTPKVLSTPICPP